MVVKNDDRIGQIFCAQVSLLFLSCFANPYTVSCLKQNKHTTGLTITKAKFRQGTTYPVCGGASQPTVSLRRTFESLTQHSSVDRLKMKPKLKEQ